MLTPKVKRRIMRALREERPTVWVGKEGTTVQIINEVTKQLEAREMIKVKIQKNALKEEEAKNIAMKIANQTESELVEVRGHTFMLYKKNKKR